MRTKTALKFFPEGNALGQTLILDNGSANKITAVFEDMPETGHFAFDILRSLSGLEEAKSTNFLSKNFIFILNPSSKTSLHWHFT
jgi:putative ABC transport system permease protein